MPTEIAFPRAYEVLYDLFNTMLIERIRSRRRTQFPTRAQLKALKDAVYYKELLAQATHIDLDLNPEVVFPDEDDFRRAGLPVSPGFVVPELNRLTNATESAETEPVFDSQLHPAFRLSSGPISLLEVKTKSWVRMEKQMCNEKLPASEYYPFNFQTKVWSRLQGFCARECTVWRRRRLFSPSSCATEPPRRIHVLTRRPCNLADKKSGDLVSNPSI